MFKKWLKPHFCPYCEQPISDKTLIKEPNKFFTTQQTKLFCPHCHGEVEKTLPIKPLIIGLIFGLGIAVLQGWLRSQHVMSEGWINIFGVVANAFLVYSVIFLGITNAPYKKARS